MINHKRTYKVIALVSIAVLALTAVGFTAAQDNGNGNDKGNSEGAPHMFAGGFLGIRITPSDDGVTVGGVMPDSPAAEAGLQEGDIITAVNGEPVSTPRDLVQAVRTADAGDTLTLDITRNGDDQTIEVTLGEWSMPEGFGEGYGPNGEMRFFFHDRMMGGGMTRLGVAFVQLDAETAQAEGVTQTEGALVKDVMPESPAATAGVQVGDIITAVNNEAVDAEHTLRDRLIAYEPGDSVTLSIERGSETVSVDVTIGDGMAMMEGMMGEMFDMPFEFFHEGMPFRHFGGHGMHEGFGRGMHEGFGPHMGEGFGPHMNQGAGSQGQAQTQPGNPTV